MGKRYMVCPGYVYSRSDSDRHWISADRLIRLYGVNPAECIVSTSETERRGTWAADLIRLAPKWDGDYSLPEPREGE